MEIGLSLLHTRPPQQDNTQTPLAPLAGVLDAANIVILGASIYQGAFEFQGATRAALQAYAAAAGFIGTLHSYAMGGQKVAQTIERHADAKTDLAATEGNNLYIVHSGGNNVTSSRPYPGQESTFAADYATLMANITATDSVIPLPLTKRLYGTSDPAYPNVPLAVVQGDTASEANGSKPYNDAIILPAISANAPDWLDAQGTPFVDPYAFIDSDPDMLSSDGIHGPEVALARYTLAKVAGRAKGIAANASRAGQSHVFSILNADPNAATIGPINAIQCFPNGTQNNPLFYGAITTNGDFDPHIKTRMSAFQNGTSGMDSSCFPRLADSRFHDTDLVGQGIYVQGAQVFTLTFDNLTPGDSVTASCCGVRTLAGNGRRGDVTLHDGQVLTLDGSNAAPSNQVVFNPVVIGADGKLSLTLRVTNGSTYAYLHGVILDFA